MFSASTLRQFPAPTPPESGVEVLANAVAMALSTDSKTVDAIAAQCFTSVEAVIATLRYLQVEWLIWIVERVEDGVRTVCVDEHRWTSRRRALMKQINRAISTHNS